MAHVRLRLFLITTLLCAPLVSAATVLNCHGLLADPDALRAQRDFARIISADADDAASIGYIGITESDFVRLANGKALPEYLIVRLTSDDSHMRFWSGMRPGFEFDLVPRRDAERTAISDAWLRSTRELVAARAPGARLTVGLNTFLLNLRASLSDRGESASPTVAQIRAAVAASGLLAPGATAHVTLRHLARALKLEWRGTLADELKLERMFADLPLGAGVRIALKASAYHALRLSGDERPGIRRIEPRDVVAIQPNAIASGAVLDELVGRGE